MPKFIHTADWHIGLRARHAGSRATALRAQRIGTARRILDLAVTESADFMLIAGDLFDNPDIERDTVGEVVNLLGASPLPIFVIPGNHDPLVPMSVWESISWKNRNDVVKFLDTAVPVNAPNGCMLYPCPIYQKTSIVDPTSWIPNREEADDSIRIGLAHGSLQILDEQATMDFPIAIDRAAKAGLDYLALGDWHGTRVVGATAYPGTQEQTSFADKDSGNVLIVEIASANTAPIIRPRRVGGCVWKKVDRIMRDLTDVADLRSQIKEFGELSMLCLNLSVRLSPDAASGTPEALDQLKSDLEGCFWLQWNVASFTTEEARERIPDGYLRQVYRSLEDASELGVSSEAAAQAQTWMVEIAMQGSR